MKAKEKPKDKFPLFGERLTYPEAAEYLRYSVHTLRKQVMYNRVPHIKLFGAKGRVIFLRSDLDAMIQGHRVPAA